MKYFRGKIKKEHNILEEFEKFLENLEKIDEIKKIIPWRISRKQSWSSEKRVSFSYFTKSWIKIIIKKWSTVQEVFIICVDENKKKVKEKINLLVKQSI